MNAKANYKIPAFLMTVLMISIIWLVVVYPATTYKLDKVEYNSYMAKDPKDYKVRKDYTDLEWVGRGLFFSEGCWNCHSQQTRYQDRGMGPVAIPQEFAFDAPHALGAERTGPDLAREGGKYPTRWHREHHMNPRAKYAGSIMPSFRHLDEIPLRFDDLPAGESIDAEALLKETPDELRAGMAARTQRIVAAGHKPRGNANDLWTDRVLTPEEVIYELRAIGYTDYDIKKADNRGVTMLDALDAYIQSLGPGRMFEPGGPIPSLEPTPQPQAADYDLARYGNAATATATVAAPATPATAVPGAGALPADTAAPPAWHKLAEEEATYWVPSEYQDLAAKAKDDGKIPAFEPRFINNGRGIYMDKCVHCHGLNGQGNGPTGRYMMKKPANFWLPNFKLYSDAMWFYRIMEGVPGTEMPVWKFSLVQRKESQRYDQIWYLVTWLKYVSAQSPMAAVPYDLPTRFYLFDDEQARRGAFPIDTDFIARYGEELARRKAIAEGKPPAAAAPAAAAPAAVQPAPVAPAATAPAK
jgi:cbb3-type cytochrome c oxidase subunit II